MPTYTLIMPAVVVGSGGAASIDFSSIPSTYTDLCLKLSLRSSGAVGDEIFGLTFNNTAGSITSRFLYGQGVSAASLSNVYFAQANGSTSTSSTFGNAEIYIPNYAGSTNKSISNDGVSENNATSAVAAFTAALWSQTAAINRITITPNSGSFVQYSTAYLYGVSNA
jgi:hypothetical protein